MISSSAIRPNRIPSPPHGKPNGLAAYDYAIALLREIANLECNEDGDVILGADENGCNDLLSRITIFLVDHDQ